MIEYYVNNDDLKKEIEKKITHLFDSIEYTTFIKKWNQTVTFRFTKGSFSNFKDIVDIKIDIPQTNPQNIKVTAKLKLSKNQTQRRTSSDVVEVAHPCHEYIDYLDCQPKLADGIYKNSADAANAMGAISCVKCIIVPEDTKEEFPMSSDILTTCEGYFNVQEQVEYIKDCLLRQLSSLALQEIGRGEEVNRWVKYNHKQQHITFRFPLFLSLPPFFSKIKLFKNLFVKEQTVEYMDFEFMSVEEDKIIDEYVTFEHEELSPVVEEMLNLFCDRLNEMGL